MTQTALIAFLYVSGMGLTAAYVHLDGLNPRWLNVTAILLWPIIIPLGVSLKLWDAFR